MREHHALENTSVLLHLGVARVRTDLAPALRVRNRIRDPLATGRRPARVFGESAVGFARFLATLEPSIVGVHVILVRLTVSRFDVLLIQLITRARLVGFNLWFRFAHLSSMRFGRVRVNEVTSHTSFAQLMLLGEPRAVSGARQRSVRRGERGDVLIHRSLTRSLEITPRQARLRRHRFRLFRRARTAKPSSVSRAVRRRRARGEDGQHHRAQHPTRGARPARAASPRGARGARHLARRHRSRRRDRRAVDACEVCRRVRARSLGPGENSF